MGLIVPRPTSTSLLPSKPVTGEMALVVMGEINDGAYLPRYFSREQQLVIKAEIDDGFPLEIRAKETNSTSFSAEEQLVFLAEIEDGFVGSVGFSGKEVDRTPSGEAAGVLQALLTHDAGSDFSGEQWLVIQAEIEDSSV